jgi:hypothetical protein
MNQHQDFKACALFEDTVRSSVTGEISLSNAVTRGLGGGTPEQTTLLSHYSNSMDNAFSAGGIFANHDSFTRSGPDLERRELQSQSHKATPVAPGSISQVSGTGNLVFNSSMEAVVPRRLGPRSRADKDAAQHLKRAGGACLKHKASKKRVSHGYETIDSR